MQCPPSCPSSLASLSETAMDDYTVTYYGNVVHTLHVNNVVAHVKGHRVIIITIMLQDKVIKELN